MRTTFLHVWRLFWNRQEGRPRALLRLLGQFVLLLVIITVLGVALALLLLPLGGNNLGMDFLMVAAYGAVTTLLATVISMWLAARFLDHRPFADFGLRFGAGWWIDFAFGLLLGALLIAGIFAVEVIAGWVTIVGTFRTADPGEHFALAIVLPIVLFVSVGIYEEMLSRGYLLLNLAEGLNFPVVGPRGAVLLAWLLSSVVFGLAHANNPNATFLSSIGLVLAGIFLGLGYVLTGELAIPIGLHITWNFFQGNVFGFPVSGGDFSTTTFIATAQRGPDLWTGGPFGPEGGLVGLLATLIGSLLIVLWVRGRRGRIALQTELAEFRRLAPK